MKLVLHLNYWKCMIVYNTKHLKFILQMFLHFYAQTSIAEQISKITAWNVLVLYDMEY